MKQIFCVVLLLVMIVQCSAQKTMMVEKSGTHRRFFLHEGDFLKITAVNPDTTIEGYIVAIGDSSVSLSGWRIMTFQIRNIKSVYRTFAFPAKLGGLFAAGGILLFGVITVNHLLNNEQVFTNDMFILSGSFLAAGAVSLALSRKSYQIGDRWKIKILDAVIN